MAKFRSLFWPWRNFFRRQTAVDPQITLEQYEALQPVRVVPHGDIDVIYTTPTLFTQWRVDSLFSKEPDTIAWIGSFRPGEVLVDIGANVGMYTIWAAVTRGVRVIAFEPESQNYGLLYKNIVLNDLSERVVAYCVALSDKSSYSLLHLSQFQSGGSCHTFDEKIDFNLRRRESKVSQGCISAVLDELVSAGTVPFPDHIKIDVDGLEHKVLAGCRAVLADPRLKSVLVEINTHLEQHMKIVSDMEALGFTYDREQVNQARRSEGAFAGVGNYVFRR